MLKLSRTENRILMEQARESLRGIWGLAVGTFFVFLLITGGIQQIPRAGSVFYLIIAGPMMLGATIFSLAISRKKNPKFEQLFAGFQQFGTALAALILQIVFVLLWTLLLVIPGIIAALSYSMTFFIIAEDKIISPLDAITKSKALMEGNKWKFLFLGFRFLGWALLSVLTLGIGFIWLLPYMNVSFAKFYDDIPKTMPASMPDSNPGPPSPEAE